MKFISTVVIIIAALVIGVGVFGCSQKVPESSFSTVEEQRQHIGYRLRGLTERASKPFKSKEQKQ